MKNIFLLILLLSFGSALFANQIHFNADSMSGQAGNTSSKTVLEGNASVSTESVEIKADELALSGDEFRNINATGNVSGKNLETNMEFSCDELEYDRITKKILLKGNVTLTDVENEVKCGAQIIEYNQDTDIAVMQIQISLNQKDNVCSGSYAVYYKKDQILEISGNAQVKQKEDTFRAQFIALNLETQDITLGGNVRGSVTEQKNAETKKEASKSPDADSKENAEDEIKDSEKELPKPAEGVQKPEEKAGNQGEE